MMGSKRNCNVGCGEINVDGILKHGLQKLLGTATRSHDVVMNQKQQNRSKKKKSFRQTHRPLLNLIHA